MEALEFCPSEVTFHNVASSYVPGTAVECRYTLGSPSQWHSKDWIGLFKVGWKSVREYHTYVWSPSPQRHTDRPAPESSVWFEGCNLPGDSSTLFQFCYIDWAGVCLGSSPPVTFCHPHSHDELVLLEDVGASSDMVMVVTRTSLLATQLAESEKAREQLAAMQKQLDHEVQTLKAHVRELELAGESAENQHRHLEMQCQALREESSRSLRKEQEESEAKIRGLEADTRTLRQAMHEREAALKRAEDCIRKLEGEQEDWAERIRTGTKEQGWIQRRCDGLTYQLRRAEELLAADRLRAAELEQELAGVARVRDCTAAELRWSQLQACRLEARLAEEAEEGREAEAEVKLLRVSTELLSWKSAAQGMKKELEHLQQELQREQDQSRVQLSEMMREKKEMKSGLQVVQKEKELLQREKQEMLKYIQSLEQKLEESRVKIAENQVITENQEIMAEPTGVTGRIEPASRGTHSGKSVWTGQGTEVVVQEPGANGSPLPGERQSEAECLERCSQDNVTNTTLRKSIDDLELRTQSDMRTTQPLTAGDCSEGRFPEVTTDILRECPICKQRFPERFGEAMDRHVESHFFFSTADPFLFQ